MRKRRFFFHFNKPMTQKTGNVMWSVHYADQCYFVSDIECRVPVASKSRKTQPKAVMTGKCDKVIIANGKALIE